ncbi:MAG: redox-sensing transcriptional repressor Rex [Anaerolineae bacterium]|nr:redox-sensing transcriptional repressor Rex [Anaerolineae bacterium]
MTQEKRSGAVEKQAPEIVVARLPIYLRALAHTADEGQRVIASQELAQRLGMSSAQIRKDLSHFGEFGKQGMGYDVIYLRDQLRAILNVDRVWDMVLVGAGDLGHAIANYGGFEGRGFRVVAVFDSNPQKIGRQLAKCMIRDMVDLPDVLREMKIKIGIVAVPAAAAQDVVDSLVAGGVKAILNYAPISVMAPDGVHVQYIDPVAHLQRMSYYLE